MDEQVLHCVCGAARPAPPGLTTVSCVVCGRAMSLRTELPTPAPTRVLLASATLVSQLLAASVFVLAVLWIVRHGNRDVALLGLLAGAAGVFAGGMAHRGSVGALVACSALDLALALAWLVAPPWLVAFVEVPVAALSPRLGAQLGPIMIATGVIAAAAAIACLVALPQASRFAIWNEQRIQQAVRGR